MVQNLAQLAGLLGAPRVLTVQAIEHRVDSHELREDNAGPQRGHGVQHAACNAQGASDEHNAHGQRGDGVGVDGAGDEGQQRLDDGDAPPRLELAGLLSARKRRRE